MRIAHAVCERSRDACARVHHSNLILALVVPRRERLIPRGETKRVKQCAYNGEEEEKTHNHSVECDEDATLGPVRLSICRHIVHEETRADEERDFEQICACSPLAGRIGWSVVAPTEEQRQRLVGPPTEECEEWHPEEQELYAHVDRACLGETLGG